MLTETGVRAADRTYSIEESIGFFLSLNLRRIKPLIDQKLQQHGVSYGSWFFLRVLWEEEGLTQAALAAKLSFNPATTMTALRKLAAEGLVTLKSDATDGRVLRAFLTDKGRDLKPVLLDSVEKINQSLLAGLKKSEVKELLRMLKIVGHNAQLARTFSDVDPADEA